MTREQQEESAPAVFPEERIAAYCKQMGWARTGVHARPEDIERCTAWMEEWHAAPVARVLGVWMNEAAESLFKIRVHELAMSYGLPDLAPTPDGPDRYGILATGEFTKLETAEVRRG